jgi:2OG-Fe(II) oxygenase superfamily
MSKSCFLIQFSCFISFFCAILCSIAEGRRDPYMRHIEISNESGERVAIDWVDPITGELRPYGVSEPSPNHHFSIDSFVNHTFVVRKVIRNFTNNGSETDSNMKSTILKVGDQDEQYFVVTKDLIVDVVNDDPALVRPTSQISQSAHPGTIAKSIPTPPSENSLPNDDTEYIITKCHEKVRPEVRLESSLDDIMKELVECLTNETASAFMIKNEYLGFQKDLRKQISDVAENYTCANPNLHTSKPIEVRTWTNNGVIREVGILHQRPSSQIHIIHDFISQDECDAIEKAAQPDLHRGVVCDGKGGSQLSESRKAWQAGLTTKRWNDPSDPIATVKRRLFAYANFVTGYNMSLDGQEDIMSIQYFGNGYNDTTPDRYTPHCDGDCDGLPHKTGGRVATMVMYCDVPIAGGATNFQNANVYVKPTKYAGVFFSYMNPKTHQQEEGLTSHSGCPVYEGTKRIAVQWMRVGVDKENPWDSFDTNTISLKLKQDEDGI